MRGDYPIPSSNASRLESVRAILILPRGASVSASTQRVKGLWASSRVARCRACRTAITDAKTESSSKQDWVHALQVVVFHHNHPCPEPILSPTCTSPMQYLPSILNYSPHPSHPTPARAAVSPSPPTLSFRFRDDYNHNYLPPTHLRAPSRHPLPVRPAPGHRGRTRSAIRLIIAWLSPLSLTPTSSPGVNTLP